MAFHTETLHSTFLLVKTLHGLEPSVGSLFRDLESQLYLLPRSMTDPTNQHETFQCALSSLTRFLGNFPEGHPSHNIKNIDKLNVITYLKHVRNIKMLNYMKKWNELKAMKSNAITKCSLFMFSNTKSNTNV